MISIVSLDFIKDNEKIISDNLIAIKNKKTNNFDIYEIENDDDLSEVKNGILLNKLGLVYDLINYIKRKLNK